MEIIKTRRIQKAEGRKRGKYILTLEVTDYDIDMFKDIAGGAPGTDDGGNSNVGSCYIYEWPEVVLRHSEQSSQQRMPPENHISHISILNP